MFLSMTSLWSWDKNRDQNQR